MTPEQRRRIHAFWAHAYGFDAATLGRPGFSLVALEGLVSPPRLVVLRTNTTAVVFVPPSLTSQLGVALAPSEGQVITGNDVQAALGELPVQRGNTDFILYFDDSRPLDQNDLRVRQLGEHDAPALDVLNGAVSVRDQALGNVSLEHDVVLGFFGEDQLLGAASLIVEGDVADVGVLIHPEARGRGVGRALVAALTREGIQRGWLVQYTTLESNVGSVKLARAAGFTLFATEEALRITGSLSSS